MISTGLDVGLDLAGDLGYAGIRHGLGGYDSAKLARVDRSMMGFMAAGIGATALGFSPATTGAIIGGSAGYIGGTRGGIAGAMIGGAAGYAGTSSARIGLGVGAGALLGYRAMGPAGAFAGAAFGGSLALESHVNPLASTVGALGGALGYKLAGPSGMALGGSAASLGMMLGTASPSVIMAGGLLFAGSGALGGFIPGIAPAFGQRASATAASYATTAIRRALGSTATGSAGASAAAAKSAMPSTLRPVFKGIVKAAATVDHAIYTASSGRFRTGIAGGIGKSINKIFSGPKTGSGALGYAAVAGLVGIGLGVARRISKEGDARSVGYPLAIAGTAFVGASTAGFVAGKMLRNQPLIGRNLARKPIATALKGVGLATLATELTSRAFEPIYSPTRGMDMNYMNSGNMALASHYAYNRIR
jgi:hypothetical protein